jgi:DNA-binding response OmpR family regulator
VRVLVVEDERRLAAAVRRGLAAEGFAVDLAHNGEDGLHAAREGGYDAVVLDLMLPRISGYRVCQQLRAEENWVPILILSAKDGEYDQADGLDLGADDYLTKPFSYVVLAARLRALLRRGAVPRPAQLQAGDLTLDPASRRVRRAEADIELTAREFALLEYLMRRSGQVVSKTELLEHVWDSYDSLDLNVVEVYAGYLRRKIDAPFSRSALQTVRGAGYRAAGPLPGEPAARRRRTGPAPVRARSAAAQLRTPSARTRRAAAAGRPGPARPAPPSCRGG